MKVSAKDARNEKLKGDATVRIRSFFSEIRDNTPGFGVAVFGLALALLLKEAQKIPGYQNVSMGAPERWVPAVIALVPIALLFFAYKSKPMFRLHRSPVVGFCIGGAILLATLLDSETTVFWPAPKI